jgi:hypothetical protein
VSIAQAAPDACRAWNVAASTAIENEPVIAAEMIVSAARG